MSKYRTYKYEQNSITSHIYLLSHKKQRTCRMKQFVVPQATTSMENQILQFFDSFKVTVHDIPQSMKNAWNEKGTRVDETFIDHAYKFCICKILDQKPILLNQMIGLGALAPQLIANDTKRVVSVLSESSRNWFMPFQLRNSFHITEPQRMISCIGLIPILTKTMEIEIKNHDFYTFF